MDLKRVKQAWESDVENKKWSSIQIEIPKIISSCTC